MANEQRSSIPVGLGINFQHSTLRNINNVVDTHKKAFSLHGLRFTQTSVLGCLLSIRTMRPFSDAGLELVMRLLRRSMIFVCDCKITDFESSPSLTSKVRSYEYADSKF